MPLPSTVVFSTCKLRLVHSLICWIECQVGCQKTHARPEQGVVSQLRKAEAVGQQAGADPGTPQVK